MAIGGYMYNNKCRTDIFRCQPGIVYLVINLLCIIRYRISGKGSGGCFLLLALDRPSAFRRRSVGGTDIIDKSIILGKINAGDIPIILGRPVCHLADHVHHSGGTNLNLVFLLTLRLGERHGIRCILLAATDGELLVLRVDQHLDVRSEVQLCSGLIVELQDIAGDVNILTLRSHRFIA